MSVGPPSSVLPPCQILRVSSFWPMLAAPERGVVMDRGERAAWALNDRPARILIGGMLVIQIMILAALIWL